jgi:hypothetical protein
VAASIFACTLVLGAGRPAGTWEPFGLFLLSVVATLVPVPLVAGPIGPSHEGLQVPSVAGIALPLRGSQHQPTDDTGGCPSHRGSLK